MASTARARSHELARASNLAFAEVLVGVSLCAWTTLLLAQAAVTPDTFLCLVLGRDVLRAGLPHVNR